MTTHPFLTDTVDNSWKPVLAEALQKMNPDYLAQLSQSDNWLPGKNKIFNAFSLPIKKTDFVLFGESPYPRQQSANGYAFWDASITSLWSETGFSKPVNRATSMRNFLKMLLVADGSLKPEDTSQNAIAALNKSSMIQSANELFEKLLQHGFLLLNTTPVLQPRSPQKDAREWQPFMQFILQSLIEQQPELTFILFGRIAQNINELVPDKHTSKICSEHPYNVSFIHNAAVQDFFKSFQLLKA